MGFTIVVFGWNRLQVTFHSLVGTTLAIYEESINIITLRREALRKVLISGVAIQFKQSPSSMTWLL
jgi:hypothetical protein